MAQGHQTIPPTVLVWDAAVKMKVLENLALCSPRADIEGEKGK